MDFEDIPAAAEEVGGGDPMSMLPEPEVEDALA